MTILFAGTEEIDFVTIAGSKANWQNYYRSSVGRAGIRVYSNGTQLGSMATPPFTPTNPIWVTARQVWPATPPATPPLRFMEFYSGSDLVADLRCTTTFAIALRIRNTAGDLVEVAETIPGILWETYISSAASYYKFDYNIDLASSGGSVKIYRNGRPALNYTGNTLGNLPSGTKIDSVRFNSTALYNGADYTYSEIIIADIDTRTLSVAGMQPASLTRMDWLGTVGNINEIILDRNTTITGGLSGTYADMTLTALPDAVKNLEVYTLKVTNEITGNGTTPNAVALGHSSANTSTFAYTTPVTAPNGAYLQATNYFDMNYIDNVKWDASNLSGLIISLKTS